MEEKSERELFAEKYNLKKPEVKKIVMPTFIGTTQVQSGL